MDLPSDYDQQADDDGRCRLCGMTLDIDANGHSEDCRWAR